MLDKNEPSPPIYIKVPRIARRWDTSQAHVYRLIESGKLAHVRLGNAIRVAVADLEQFERAK